jgi:2-polyprenyl-3-methyl-5-hydroxy-6-metoxy-1,4-benzoquinol methylase
MNPQTSQLLQELNHRFYSDFGAQFSQTRRRIQPGVRAILSKLEGHENILDLGCGNGEIARCLADSQFLGRYTGLDFSLPLLEAASDHPEQFPIHFAEADLSSTNWDLAVEPHSFDLVTSFAVMHHIPGLPLRQEIIHKVQRLLKPSGKFILSNWQFLNSEKLKNRIQPWQTIGLRPTDVDEGDYLLDWRSGGTGLRYVHSFTEAELTELAFTYQFQVVSSFYSDGEGGRLGLYQIWEKHEN